KRAKLPRHVQRKIFFTPITADCAFVMTSVSRIQDDSLNIANVRHAMRANQRLNGVGYIGTRHKKFSVLLDEGKAQPTARSVEDDLSAAADELERTLDQLGLNLTARGCGWRG